MDNETPILTADYITTEADYINTNMAQLRYETKGFDKVLTQVLGVIAICCGVCTLIFVGGSFIKNMCWILLILIGMFLVSLHEVINPYMTRTKAKKVYEANKDKFVSRNIFFYDDYVKIVSDRYKGNIPYKYLFCALEDRNVLILYLDKNDYISIPKRVFSENDSDALEKVRALIGNKYVKRK